MNNGGDERQRGTHDFLNIERRGGHTHIRVDAKEAGVVGGVEESFEVLALLVVGVGGRRHNVMLETYGEVRFVAVNKPMADAP